jgi:transcriptional regulator with XRE-family HTH domain
MATAGLFSRPAEVESVDTSSTKQKMLQSLRSSEEYRHAFIEEAIRTRITAQIAALRDKEGWDYKKLAEKIDRKVSWAYRLENPNESTPTIPSLLEVAAAFDIGLDVRFRRFSELLDDVATLTPESFIVPSFEEEVRMGAFSRRKRRKIARPNTHRRKKKIELVGKKHSYKADIGASKPPSLALAS